MKRDADSLLFTIDIVGTILFGIEGATAQLPVNSTRSG